MIRRIIVFLGMLFVGFFVYRWYNQPAADELLFKLKNLSFSKKANYTTTITDTNGSGTELIDAGVIEKINDTVTPKTNESNESLINQILTQSNLEQGVNVPGITGKVVTNTGSVETISAQPRPVSRPVTLTPSQPTTTQSSQPQQIVQPYLSEEDKRQAEEFSNLFH